MFRTNTVTADEALTMLKQGNQQYIDRLNAIGDTSSETRLYTATHGQHPYAIILGCSDSREIPESIFMAGIGDLFVIRVAGNVIGQHELGSIQYASGHLGSKLVVVLGHTFCGAVDAAMHHPGEGYVKSLTDAVKEAIGEETDPVKASCMNVRNSVRLIHEKLHTHDDELLVVGALYHLETGEVEFLDVE